MTAPHRFWDWSAAAYAAPGVEPLLLALQDRHSLNVNMLLWVLWCAERFEAADDIVIRKADDLSRRWSSTVTAPLRAVRRTLKSPPLNVSGAAAEALGNQIKKSELAAEQIEQEALEALAIECLKPARETAGAPARARKSLAAYVRLTDAIKTPGFSVSLLENLIRLSFRQSESDGDSVG